MAALRRIPDEIAKTTPRKVDFEHRDQRPNQHAPLLGGISVCLRPDETPRQNSNHGGNPAAIFG